MTEARKILTRGNVQRPTDSVKASGDTGGKPQARHKNKDKIPKSLRYDLENALVGLCDVWFGEIKPYLVHNNVKVHVHEGEGGGGDREASTAECSHLDPGRAHQRQRLSAGCADCYSMPQTASRARFPRPPLQLVSSLKLDRSMESPRLKNCKNDPKKSRISKRQPAKKSPPRPLVPRLWQTYAIPPPKTPIQPVVNNNNIGLYLQKPRYNNKYRLKIMKDASTQTERRIKVRVKKMQVIPKESKESKKEIYNSPFVKKYPIKNNNVVKTESKGIHPKPLSPQFGRCQATTTFIPQKITTPNLQPALFKDDLINIISAKHDRKIKVLYTSPIQEEYPSIMNLYSPTCNLITTKKTYKAPPWR